MFLSQLTYAASSAGWLDITLTDKETSVVTVPVGTYLDEVAQTHEKISMWDMI